MSADLAAQEKNGKQAFGLVSAALPMFWMGLGGAGVDALAPFP
jgi:hypothetical protein